LHQALAVIAAAVRISYARVQGVLGGQDELGTPIANQFPDDPLAAAAGVVVGCVDEIAARLDVRLKHFGGFFLRCAPAPVLAEGHGTQAQFRNA